jgi:hypothetical protein
LLGVQAQRGAVVLVGVAGFGAVTEGGACGCPAGVKAMSCSALRRCTDRL